MNYQEIGSEIMKQQLLISNKTIPLVLWDDFSLFFTIEYGVNDFEAEVGFYRHVFGFDFLSVSQEYAIVKHPDNNWTFSFKKVEETHPASIKLQLFTKDLNSVETYIKESSADYTIINHSDHQRIIRVMSPNNYIVEVWSGWEDAIK